MVLILIICILILFLLAAGGYAYKIAFYSPRGKQPDPPPALTESFAPYQQEITRLYRQIRDRECEIVSIVSHDGLELSGRYYHIADGAPLDIGFHGYRSSAFTDFAGGSEMSFDMGHNLLLVDQRSHGMSAGRTISFGIKERLDVLSWTQYAVDRFGQDAVIYLYGVSMGASTVLMAADQELPPQVKAIFADCPFSFPLDVILHVGKSNPLPQWLIRIAAIVGAAVYGGFDLLETDAARAVAGAGIPILILHGEADTYVPCPMSEAAANANPALVRRFTFPGAEHALSYLADTPRYRKIVKDFLSSVNS